MSKLVYIALVVLSISASGQAMEEVDQSNNPQTMVNPSVQNPYHQNFESWYPILEKRFHKELHIIKHGYEDMIAQVINNDVIPLNIKINLKESAEGGSSYNDYDEPWMDYRAGFSSKQKSDYGNLVKLIKSNAIKIGLFTDIDPAEQLKLPAANRHKIYDYASNKHTNYPYTGVPVENTHLHEFFVNYIYDIKPIDIIKGDEVFRNYFKEYPAFYDYIIQQLNDGNFNLSTKLEKDM